MSVLVSGRGAFDLVVMVRCEDLRSIENIEEEKFTELVLDYLF